MEGNIIRYQFNPPAVYNDGLGFRLFGKTITWRSVLKVAAEKILDYVGATLDAATGGIFHGFIEEGKTRVKTYLATKGLTQKTATVLTVAATSEDDYLAAWVDNKLTPYCAALVNQLSVLQDANATLATKIAALNSVTNKIDTVQDHLAAYDYYDLSADGVDSRSALLSIAFEPIYTVIKAYVDQLGLVTYASSFNPQGTSFAPMFTSTPLTQVPTEVYKARAGVNTGTAASGTTIGATSGTATSTAGTIAVGNLTVPRSSATAGQAAATIGAMNTGATTVFTQANTANAATDQDSNTGLYIVGGAVVIGVLYAIFKPKPAKGMTGPRRGKRTKK